MRWNGTRTSSTLSSPTSTTRRPASAGSASGRSRGRPSPRTRSTTNHRRIRTI
ncbi:hypothetical protein S40288_11618, partial [Stachybotrys chartarum IBT 40288]